MSRWTLCTEEDAKTIGPRISEVLGHEWTVVSVGDRWVDVQSPTVTTSPMEKLVGTVLCALRHGEDMEHCVTLREQEGILAPYADAGLATSFTPLQLGRLYDFPPGDGHGQRVGIVQLGGLYKPSDLATYFSLLKLGRPPTVRVVHLAGAVQRDTSDSLEVALDVQILAALAPRALITIYFAPNSLAGFYQAIATAVAENSVVSISWGIPERYVNREVQLAFDAVIRDGTGTTVLVASGDDGSDGGVVSFPANLPHVTACGGTTVLTTNPNGSTKAEVAWRGSGGGYSAHLSAPPYQDSLDHTHRGVPDVAGCADPSTGYRIYTTTAGKRGWDVVGGTSAVAPFLAALVARINARLPSPLGFLNPLLYAVPSTALYDVQTGDNGGYRAKVGWDAVTGVGSLIGSRFAAHVGATAPEPAPARAPTRTTAPRRRAPLVVVRPRRLPSRANGWGRW